MGQGKGFKYRGERVKETKRVLEFWGVKKSEIRDGA